MSDKELRELDAWIAEHVMGWKRTNNPDAATHTNEVLFWHRKEIGKRHLVVVGTAYEMKFENGSLFSHSWKDFSPTTDPAAAMAVLEKLTRRREDVGVVFIDGKFKAYRFLDLDITKKWWVEADTLPLAICLLAKKLSPK